MLRGFAIDDWLENDGELPKTGGQISQRGLGGLRLAHRAATKPVGSTVQNMCNGR